MSVSTVGIDLSLTGTGLCSIEKTTTSVFCETKLVQTTGHKGDSLTKRRSRLHRIKTEIRHFVLRLHPDLVVIEGPSIGSRYGSAHDRSGLWWLVVDDLKGAFPIAVVPPTSRAKYATGKGNAKKPAVMAGVAEHFDFTEVTDNNVADATVLAAMGMRHLFFPVDDLPEKHTMALAGCEWPW